MKQQTIFLEETALIKKKNVLEKNTEKQNSSGKKKTFLTKKKLVFFWRGEKQEALEPFVHKPFEKKNL